MAKMLLYTLNNKLEKRKQIVYKNVVVPRLYIYIYIYIFRPVLNT